MKGVGRFSDNQASMIEPVPRASDGGILKKADDRFNGRWISAVSKEGMKPLIGCPPVPYRRASARAGEGWAPVPDIRRAPGEGAGRRRAYGEFGVLASQAPVGLHACRS
jgi:hypothetical protein